MLGNDIITLEEQKCSWRKLARVVAIIALQMVEALVIIVGTTILIITNNSVTSKGKI